MSRAIKWRTTAYPLHSSFLFASTKPTCHRATPAHPSSLHHPTVVIPQHTQLEKKIFPAGSPFLEEFILPRCVIGRSLRTAAPSRDMESMNESSKPGEDANEAGLESQSERASWEHSDLMPRYDRLEARPVCGRQPVACDELITKLVTKRSVFDEVDSILKREAWGPETEETLREFIGRITPELVVEVIVSQEVDPGLNFFRWFKRRTDYTHQTAIYNAMIEKLAIAHKFSTALELLQDMASEGCRADSLTFIPLILHYGKAGLVEEAIGLLNYLKLFDLPITFKIHMSLGQMLLENHCSGPDYKEMLSLVPTLDKDAVNAFLSALGRAGKFDEIDLFLKKFEGKGFTPNGLTYNILIDSTCRADKLEDALKLITLMQEKGFQPDAYSYNPIIFYYAKSKKVEEASKIFEHMKGGACPPDVVTHNHIIFGYLNVGKVYDALAHYQKMLEEGPGPNNNTYKILFPTLFRKKEFEKVLKMFNDAESRGLIMNLHFYNSILTLLSNSGRMQEAEKVFAKMLDGIYLPNVHSYILMMNGYFNADNVEAAMHVLEQMNKIAFHPTADVYGCVISGLCRAKRKKEVGMILKEMLGRCSHVDKSLYARILRELCAAGLLNEGIKVCRHAVANRVILLNTSVSSFFRELRQAGLNVEADKLKKGLHDNGCIHQVSTLPKSKTMAS